MLSCVGASNVTGTIRGTLGALNASSFSNGVTTGTVTGTNLAISVSDPLGSCTTGAQGELDTAAYSNSGVLTIRADSYPALTIPSATGSGCAIFLVRAGDRATVQTAFAVSPAFQISSP
jgi:hypothetical protein